MKVDIKVVLLDGTRHLRHLHTAGRRRLSALGINQVLKQEADRVEQFFPGREFRLVPLRGSNFNFVEIKPELALEAQRPGEAQG